MPTYRAILKKALTITFSHKKLWLLGFWVALLGNGGEYEIFLKNTRQMSATVFDASDIPAFFTAHELLKPITAAIKNIFIAEEMVINLLTVLMFAGLVYLTIMAQGTLIISIYSRYTNQKHLLKEQWIELRKKFWTLLFTNVIIKGIGLIAALLISLPVLLLLSRAINIPFTFAVGITAFLIFTPLAIIASFLLKYTLLFILIKGKEPRSALVGSVKLFAKYWLISLENAFLLFIINFFIGILTFGIVILISFPFVATLGVSTYPLALPEGHYATIIAWIALVVGPIVGSILSVFQYSTWTLLFTTLTSRKIMHSKLARVTADALQKVWG